MAGVRIDMAAALAIAQALGSAPEVTGELLAAIADGMAEAQVKRAKERRDGSCSSASLPAAAVG
jgi:hypothetical protein